MGSRPSVAPLVGVLPGPTHRVCQGRTEGLRYLGLSHEGFGVLGSLHTGSPSGEWGDTSFWSGRTPLGNVWLGYMKSESIPKALYGNLHKHLLFAMNPQKSFIHSKSRHCLPGGRHRAEIQDNIYDGDRPALSSSSFQGRGRGGQGTGGDESWVKPLMGEEGFGHSRQEGCLVMPELRFEDRTNLARQRERGARVLQVGGWRA